MAVAGGGADAGIGAGAVALLTTCPMLCGV